MRDPVQVHARTKSDMDGLSGTASDGRNAVRRAATASRTGLAQATLKLKLGGNPHMVRNVEPPIAVPDGRPIPTSEGAIEMRAC
jgi:hypothetical protein